MGAWGYKVLENDHTLDVLSNINPFYTPEGEKAKQAVLVENVLFSQTENLLTSNNEHSKLLGVALVDIVLNNLDWSLYTSNLMHITGHEIFFSFVHDYESLTMLKEKALKAIDQLIDTGAVQWSNPKNRLEVYYVFRRRLRKHIKETEGRTADA